MRLRRRIALGALVVLLLLLAVPGYFIARGVLFPPRFAVASIAGAAEYQDQALLARAWALPVAARYRERVAFQSNGSVCGPASIATVEHSLGKVEATIGGVLAGTGKCSLGVCWGGLTLDELAVITRMKTGRRVTLVRDLTLESFRRLMVASNEPGRRTLVNFHRGLLFGKGTGHHSPVGGYLADLDLVFVLDVNARFGPWLVKTERLFTALDSVDGSSGKKRGVLLIE